MRMLMTMAAVALVATAAEAQTLRDRIAGVRNGSVRFEYAAAEGVCGNGRGNIQIQREGRGRLSRNESGSREWQDECESGPVRIALDVSGGQVTALRAYVGGSWRGTATTDLGDVPAAQAQAYLLGLAETAPEKVAKAAIFPAMIADAEEPWRRLLTLAKDEDRPRAVRNDAVFWVGQGAADAATSGLAEIADDRDGDREVRKSAVFALSQQRNDEAVPALIRIARQNRDPEIRRSAIFWLGQSGDRRAVAYFEELLVSK